MKCSQTKALEAHFQLVYTKVWSGSEAGFAIEYLLGAVEVGTGVKECMVIQNSMEAASNICISNSNKQRITWGSCF